MIPNFLQNHNLKVVFIYQTLVAQWNNQEAGQCPEVQSLLGTVAKIYSMITQETQACGIVSQTKDENVLRSSMIYFTSPTSLFFLLVLKEPAALPKERAR
jgi:hypothetical protein